MCEAKELVMRMKGGFKSMILDNTDWSIYAIAWHYQKYLFSPSKSIHSSMPLLASIPGSSLRWAPTANTEENLSIFFWDKTSQWDPFCPGNFDIVPGKHVINLALSEFLAFGLAWSGADYIGLWSDFSTLTRCSTTLIETGLPIHMLLHYVSIL